MANQTRTRVPLKRRIAHDLRSSFLLFNCIVHRILRYSGKTTALGHRPHLACAMTEDDVTLPLSVVVELAILCCRGARLLPVM